MKLLYVRSVGHGKHTMYYAPIGVWKCILPTGLIQNALFYPYNSKQIHILVKFCLLWSENKTSVNEKGGPTTIRWFAPYPARRPSSVLPIGPPLKKVADDWSITLVLQLSKFGWSTYFLKGPSLGHVF